MPKIEAFLTDENGAVLPCPMPKGTRCKYLRGTRRCHRRWAPGRKPSDICEIPKLFPPPAEPEKEEVTADGE